MTLCILVYRILLTSTSEVYGDPLVHPQPESYWGNVNPIGKPNKLLGGILIQKASHVCSWNVYTSVNGKNLSCEHTIIDLVKNIRCLRRHTL